jgi:hypothetical protein
MGMRKFRIVSLFLLPTVFVFLLTIFWFRSNPGVSTDRINLENFNRLRGGMSKKDVERILGGPPGDYTRSRVKLSPAVIWIRNGKEYAFPTREGEDWTKGAIWLGNEAAIKVEFDSDGQVILMDYRLVGPVENSFMENIRGLLRPDAP